MILDINFSAKDIIVIFVFVLLNLLIGIYFSRGVASIKEYALGNRNFGTATITATIVATWIGGSSFPITIYESYQNGLYFIIPGLADGFSFFIIAYIYGPRMQEFLGKLSIAEAMGDMYGNTVRACTAISAIIPAIGNVAIQFSMLTVLLTNFIGMSGMYAVMLSSIVVITYSTFGGIKAVTFTDLIQFLTFGVIIPMTAFFIWLALDEGAVAVIRTLETNPLFDYSNFVDYNNPRFLGTLLLFLFFLIPGVDPALFQRISMARNVKQVMKSFFVAGLIITVCEYMVLNFIGLLLLSDPKTINLEASNVATYILDNFLDVGFKGAFVVGIMAMCMSTADSYINTASVLLSYDLPKAMGIKISERWELFSVRLTAFLVGVLALILSIFSQNLLDFILNTYSFYMPIVSVPFVLAILGFRSTRYPVLLGMFAGFIAVCALKLYTNLDAIALGMLANIIIYMGSHYLLSQHGGWVGIRDNGAFLEIKQERRERVKDLCFALKNFSIIGYLKNALVKQESILVYLGFFCIISTFFSLYSLPKIVTDQNKLLINIISYTALFLSTILITYPAWAESSKNKLFISSISHLAIFLVLVFSSSLLVLISHFGQLQIIVLTASLITATILLRWHVALLFIITGNFAAIQFYKNYTGLSLVFENITMEFSIIYVMLMASAVSIVFLKPKEDALDISEARSNHLWEKINDMDREVRNANHLKTEFLNNINHEVRTPMTGITSLGQALWDNYDNIPEDKRRECIYTIAKSSERLISLTNNILDFSALTSLKMELYLKKVNLSYIVQGSIKRCKKLYLDEKVLRFDIDIENNLYTKCDEHHIQHTIDNLIINAIAYSQPDSTVKITLQQREGTIYFAIRDEGIGIPQNELFDIFRPFTVSSKTRTPAGGRGVGLALCYAAIVAHKGRIWAESDGASWAEFKFEI